MREPIDDALVDATEVEATRTGKVTGLVTLTGPSELDPLRHVLATVSWGHLDMIARQVADGYGFGNDAGQVVVSGTPDAEEDDLVPFEGVLVSAHFGGDVVIGHDAFRRLMARFFTVMIEAAQKRKLPILDDERWPAFLEHAARLGVAPPA